MKNKGVGRRLKTTGKFTIKKTSKNEGFGDPWNIYIYIPGSSRYVKCMPLVVFLGEKAQILHTWKIQVYILCFFQIGLKPPTIPGDEKTTG